MTTNPATIDRAALREAFAREVRERYEPEHFANDVLAAFDAALAAVADPWLVPTLPPCPRCGLPGDPAEPCDLCGFVADDATTQR